jgi:UDP-N-acetylmuramoyl-tripeptide--D-alanyl-D-alanine ligase
VVTAVAPIHLARMGTVEAIAREKSELVAALPPDGLAVLNGDDPWTRAMGRVSGAAPVALVGLSDDCQYRAVEVVSRGLAGTSLTVLGEGRELPLRTQVPGAHTVHAFLAGIAVARHLGVGWEEVKSAAEAARLVTRQRVLRGPDGLLIIDDSYNAAPMSMRAALALLQTCPGPRVAVLGDMLELGPGEEEAHREVGACAAGAADWLVLRGARAAWIADEALRRGMPPGRVVQTEDNQEAVQAVRDIASRPAVPAGARPGAGDEEADGNAGAVLVKGSRGMRMEEIVEGLRGEGCTAEI